MSIIYYTEKESLNCRYRIKENTISEFGLKSENQSIKNQILLYHSPCLKLESINNLIILKKKLTPSLIYVCSSNVDEELVPIFKELGIELITNHNKCFLCDLNKEFLPIIDKIVSDILPIDKYLNSVTKKTLNYIVRDFANIKLNKLSKELKISSDHLSRLFKKDTGYTFREFINKIKHNLAKELLLKEGYDYMLVSYKLEYKDVNNFNRFFKRMEGISPRKFIKLKSLKKNLS